MSVQIVICVKMGRVFKWVYIKGRYEVVAVKRKYKLRTKTLQRIRDGDY